MIVNYLCWSTLISLLAIILLYPLRNHAHGARVTRISAAVFLFPSFISALVSQILIIKNDVIFISIARHPAVKMQFGFQISQHNIPIIIALNFMMITMIFLLSRRKFVEHCFIASLTALFIFLVAATPDQLVRISAFSLGCVILTGALIAQDLDKLAINFLAFDFIINRLSDFLAFIALLHVLLQFNVFLTNEINLAENNVEFIHNFLFFSSVVVRLISVSIMASHTATTIAAVKMMVFYRLLLSIGAQILFLFYAAPSPQDEQLRYVWFFGALMPLVIACVASAFNKEKWYSINNVATLVFTGNLLLIVLGLRMISTAIMCLLIAGYPWASLLAPRRIIDFKDTTIRARLRAVVIVYLSKIAQGLALISFMTATLLANFFTIMYTGFLLYRLPQFLLAALQIPLRFLNNGSIQRSLVFVVVMLLAYSYWWGDS